MKIRIAATLILAIFFCGSVSGQGRSNKKVVLTGIIVNRDSIPVSDVLIFIDGKSTNAKTNVNGEFRVKFKPDAKKLSFFSAADGIFEIDYVGQERLEITMNHDPGLLPGSNSIGGEIVENGYGKVTEDNNVGSISSVKDDRFKNRSYNNIYEMIAGEVSGVSVVGTSIRIRGVTSINGSNDPLLIVDGSPVYSFNHISPHDVESINILKGSSAAIYGVRGAAGVVVVKTKSGNRK